MSDVAPAPRLDRSRLGGLPQLGASAPLDPARAGIIHLGLGAFHRAHAAVHTARALAAEEGDCGIVGFANRSRSVIEPMARQDGIYSVLEMSDAGTRADLVDVHRGFGVMTEEPARVVREIADLHRRPLYRRLLDTGVFTRAAVLRPDKTYAVHLLDASYTKEGTL